MSDHRYSMADHIKVTAYNGESGEGYRYGRLEQAVAFAAGAASIKHHIPPRLFLQHLLAVHDHKGVLSCLWDDLEAGFAFCGLMADAWSAQGEPPDMVEHFCGDYGFVTRGGLGEAYQPTEWEHQQEWPGE